MFAILVSEKGGEQRRLEFDKPEVTIGRVQGNDIILPKGNVSKRHSRIVLKDGKFIIVDLKSTNGTYVNGRKISSPLVVKSSDKIYIGDFILSIEEGAGASVSDDGGDRRPTVPPPPPAPRRSQPTETVPVDHQNEASDPNMRASGEHAGGGDDGEDEPRGPRSTMPSALGADNLRNSQPPLQAPQPSGQTLQPTVGMPPIVPPARPNTATPVIPVNRQMGPQTPPPEPPPRPAPPPPQRPTAQIPAVPQPSAQTSAPPPSLPIAATRPIQNTPPPSLPTRDRERERENTPPPSLPVAQPAPISASNHAATAAAPARLTVPRVVERASAATEVVRAASEQLLHRLGDIESHHGRRDAALWMKAEALAIEALENWPNGLPTGVDVDAATRDIVAETVGVGPLDELLAEAAVTWISVPRGERIFLERGGVQSVHGRGFSSPGASERAVNRLLGRAGAKLPRRGSVDALVDGVWITAVKAGAGVAVVLRRPAALPSLGELVRDGVLSGEAGEFLSTAVRARRNVLVVGPTRGLRDPVIAALTRACEGERGAVFDVAASANYGGIGWATFDVSPTTIRGDLGEALRLDWDRIVIPEVLGPEAVDLANYLVGGHDGAIVGFAASSADEAAVRWGELGQLQSSQATSLALRSALGHGFSVAIEVGRQHDGRLGVVSVSEVVGREGAWELRPVFEGPRPGAISATGYRPSWADGSLRA